MQGSYHPDGRVAEILAKHGYGDGIDLASYGATETLKAIGDAHLRGMGCLKDAELHPFAQALVERGDVSFAAAARHVAAIHRGYEGLSANDIPDSQVVSMSLSTGDFPDLLANTASGIARERRSLQLDGILALTFALEATNYRPQSWSHVDLDGVPQPSTNTAPTPYAAVKIRPTGEQVQIASVFCKIEVPREALINDDRGLFRAGVLAFLAAAARNEAAMLYGLIAANPTLKDGQALFGAATSSLVTSTALDSDGLGAAYAALRKQPTESGATSDAPAATLLVHADDEVTALELTESLPEARRPLVVATSALPDATSWYILGDPEDFPVFGRVRMVGSEVAGVTFERAVPAKDSFAIALPVSHQVGFSILSRIGAVRVDKP